MLMKTLCSGISVFLSAVMLLGMVPVHASDDEIQIVQKLYQGEASSEAWHTAVTVEITDTSLFSEEYMIRLVCEGNQAPAFVLSSWSGGEEWVSISPCARIEDALFYSYEDMAEQFGTDMSLLDSVSVMARNAPITLYELDIVTADSVKNAENDTPSERRVVGYLPDWSYSFYKELDFSTLTHINIAFCNPDTNGELSNYIPDQEMKAIVEKAHENDVKVLAALGGGGGCDNYPALLKDEAAMVTFNENIMEYCEKYDLDGIDLDIELGSNSELWEYYDEWCVSLRKLCDERDYLMTTATAQWVAVRVSDETFSYFDFLNVMAYDNEASPESHSTYAFAQECLDFFHIDRGIAKDKLVLGVPFYGRGYHADGSLDWNSYVSFSDIVASDTANYHKDVFEGVAYNGADTMRKKCGLARDYGGIMIWEITQDCTGEYSLLSLIKDEILTDTEIPIGDINFDGNADIVDIIFLQKYLLTLESFSETQYSAADLTKDEHVNAFDLSFLKQMLLHAK